MDTTLSQIARILGATGAVITQVVIGRVRTVVDRITCVDGAFISVVAQGGVDLEGTVCDRIAGVGCTSHAVVAVVVIGHVGATGELVTDIIRARGGVLTNGVLFDILTAMLR